MSEYSITHMLAACVMCLCASAVLGADGKPTADEVKTFTHKATLSAADKSIDEARAAFNKEGEFKHDEICVNVIDGKGVWVIYPPKPEGAGKVIINPKEADGKFLVEILRLAAEQNEGWIDYRWISPVTNQIQPKRSYVEKVTGTGYVVYVGICK